MIHVTIEYAATNDAAKLARRLYDTLVSEGRHTILDTPQDFRTNLPERRLSSADVLITAKPVSLSSTTKAKP